MTRTTQARKQLNNLVQEYLESRDFNRLTASQDHYRYWLQILCDTEVRGKPFGELLYKRITTPMCQDLYDILSDRGVTFANRILSVARKVFNYAIKYGRIEKNPFSMVQVITEKPRQVVWTQEDIVKFLNQAYAKFETRSIGLIAQMAYEWGQRIGDMRMLTWDDLDLDQCVSHPMSGFKA